MSGAGFPLELLAALPPLLPLAAALAIGARLLFSQPRGDAAEGLTARLAVGAAAAALLAMTVLDALVLLGRLPSHVTLGSWFAAGDLRVPLSFTLDALSLGIGTLAAVIAFLTLRFSVNYMHREAGFHRFFMILSLFASGMLCILLAGNAALAFVGWELAGVSSYLLIGYAMDRSEAAANAVRAFVTNRIGDAGFLAGMAAAIHFAGTLQWPGIAEGAAHLGTLPAGLMALGFVAAALAKSAQVPFAPWIGRALEGPTPSSAIFYGSLMVHAGVYLLIRIEPLLSQAPAVMALLAALGLLTVLYGALAGLTQTDVKSALMFATTTQVGLMVLACGLGWFGLAAWHLGLHAAWRAWQFLLAPSYMHLAGEPPRPVPAWLARRRRLYTAALQRFWLEPAGDWLLARPTRGLGRDMNALDQQVLDPLLGSADAPGDAVVKGHGVAGRLMEAVADRLARLEQHFLFQGPGGPLAEVLTRIGHYLQAVEALLERPRYLLLLIMATFAVIL